MKQLFCFPFAGGNSLSYRGLTKTLTGVDTLTVELPGRGRRSSEPLLRDPHAITDDAFDAIIPRLEPDYALFGHSMGAAVAYLVCRRIVQEGLNPPSALIVAGRCAPSVVYSEQKHLLPKDKFRQMLIDFGGLPDEILCYPEVFDYYEPILRVDIEANASLRHEPDMPMDVPVIVLAGNQDKAVSPSGLQQWQEVTSLPIQIHFFDGGHFFLFDHWDTIATIVQNAY